MVIEVNIAVNQIICLLKCFRLVPIDTLGFENREEIFRYGIVIVGSPFLH